MNLLIDPWIPVRSLDGGSPEKIALRELLCGDGRWELCLPRDDMELAALQLLICIMQTLITPKTIMELKTRIAKPLPEEEYDTVIQPFSDWFQLDHPRYPFMQVRGVAAKEPTPMDKLLAGLTGATNCCFVNEPGLATALCGGCTAIALFNLASCSPSFGGGFKPGLRGPATPITTLVQGRNLRETGWLNVLYEDEVDRIFPWHGQTKNQRPTWFEPIKAGENISAQNIGFIRGLFWQPMHVEMLPATGDGTCDSCGVRSDKVYSGFYKAKFKFGIKGLWPHPHSPMYMKEKQNEIVTKFASFGTSSAPSWTQLARIIVQQQIDDNNVEGCQPAAVVQQVRKLFRQQAQKLHLVIGGYLNRPGQASVVGRRHEVFTLNHGWDIHASVIHYLVELGLGYRVAFYKALFVFVNGIKANGIKGLGLKILQSAEAQFYRRSEPIIETTLACIDFADAAPELAKMRKAMKRVVEELFDESVRPYLQDPKLIHTMAVARNALHKHLRNLEPQEDKGGNDGTTEAS